MLIRARYGTAFRASHLDAEMELRVAVGGENDVAVTLRHPTERETRSVEGNLVCEAQGRFDAPVEIAEVLAEVSAGHVPERLKDEPEPETGTFLELEGRRVAVDALHPDYLRVSGDITVVLHQSVVDTLKRLRWRYDLPGRARPTTSALGEEWSRDGAEWHALPSQIHGYTEAIGFKRLGERHQGAVQELTRAGVREPLGHELLREARDIRDSAPRSALVIAVAAVEVGVKTYIANRVPDAAWLIENIPSPPVFKLLRDYVPQLAPRGAPPITKRLLTVVNKSVEQRDRVVHRGAEGATFVELRQTLEALSDVLHLLDIYAGHDWAAERLTEETALEVGLTQARSGAKA